MPSHRADYYHVSLSLPQDLGPDTARKWADEWAELYNGAVLSTSWVETEDGGFRLDWVMSGYPETEQFHGRTLQIEALPETDWQKFCEMSFPPFTIGRFFIHGSHFDGAVPGAVPEGHFPVCIDAAMAFGTGEHPTTAGCLTALEQLFEADFKPHTMLDMGTGSGILSFAAWQLFKPAIVAVDMDRYSVRYACRFREKNGIPAGRKGMLCKQGSHTGVRVIQDNAPYDLITANILANPLKTLAPGFAALLDPAGRMVVSGLMQDQRESVEEAYAAQGLKTVAVIAHKTWPTLIMARV